MDRVQGITLALAAFDEQGRLMVSPEGVVPCRRIANSKIDSVSAAATY